MSRQYDLVIIGSGPGGLVAAIYAQRARLDAVVVEKEMMSGGQILNTPDVDNYPGLMGIGGFELGMKFREHAEQLGAVFVEDEITGIELEGGPELEDGDGTGPEAGDGTDLEAVDGAGPKAKAWPQYTWKRVIGRKETYRTKAVIIATGATHQKLGIPGEERLAGRGVSYCATCDGAFFRNKRAAVIGGGDVALEDAVFLSGLCEKVYLIHRRDELRGAKSLQELLFSKENIEVIWDTVAEEIEGEDKVQGLRLKQVKTGQASRLEVQGVFIAVGISPNSQAFAGLVEMENGYVQAGEDCAASVPGIFAVGDVRTKLLRQVITAAADGANAAVGAERYAARFGSDSGKGA